MKNANTCVFFALGISLVAGSLEGAERVYKIEGRIFSLTADSIIVQKDSEFLEFDRIKALQDIKKEVKEGDIIGVWYSLEPKKLEVKKASKQQPGRVNPDLRHLILDDRAYYEANREERKSSGISVAN